MQELPRDATKTTPYSYVGDVPNSDTVAKVPGPFLPSVFVVRVYGGTVPCIEGRSEMERIQFASRGRPAVRSPSPRLRAISTATAMIRCAMQGDPCITGSVARCSKKSALGARCLMGESSRRTLVLGPGHFPAPHGDAVAHAARRKLEPKIRPIGCVRRVVEARLAVEGVEISADELAVFHADAGIIDEIGHAAGGVDPIVGTAGGACFRLDGLDAVLERLLDDDDAREPSVRRAVCDVELHIQCAIQIFAMPVA